MATNDMRLLQIAHFADMIKWSAQGSAFGNVKSKFPLVPLSVVLRRIKEPITIEDGVLYKRITIRNNGRGVVQRDELLGSEIGTKRQFVAHAGQFIISRIDARNGAFGIVPEELEGAVVTNDFWLFEVQNALPEYLMLVLSSERFQQYWQTQSSGTTNRQRVSESDFLNSRISLPTVEQQRAMLCRYNSCITRSHKLKEASEKIRDEACNWLLDRLSVKKREIIKGTSSLICLYKFSNLSRWDVWTKNLEYYSNVYNSVPFSCLTIGKPLYGANEKASKVKSDIRYIRITDINEDGSLGDDFVSAGNVDKRYLLHENDFLIARSGNTVGKTFLYTHSMGKAIYAGYLVKYVLNTERILPLYLFYYTKSPVFKQWIEGNMRVVGQPNINGQEYLSAPIILPPLDVQHLIAKKMSNCGRKIKDLSSQAESILKCARKQFENTIFDEA